MDGIVDGFKESDDLKDIVGMFICCGDIVGLEGGRDGCGLIIFIIEPPSPTGITDGLLGCVPWPGIPSIHMTRHKRLR